MFTRAMKEAFALGLRQRTEREKQKEMQRYKQNNRRHQIEFSENRALVYDGEDRNPRRKWIEKERWIERGKGERGQ